MFSSVFAGSASTLRHQMKGFSSTRFPVPLKSSSSKDLRISLFFLWFLCFSFLFHFHRCFCYFIFHDPFNCKTETTKYKKLPKFSWSSRSSVSCLSLFMAQMREESRKIFILLFVSYVLCWSISYWKKICVRWLINQNSSLFSLFDVKCTV